MILYCNGQWDKIKKNKFVWGLINGLSYFVILLIISTIIGGALIITPSMLTNALLSSLISGMIGGMVSWIPPINKFTIFPILL